MWNGAHHDDLPYRVDVWDDKDAHIEESSRLRLTMRRPRVPMRQPSRKVRHASREGAG